MLEKGSRVELNNGIHFYEQDIQLSEYIFTEDIEVRTEIDFLRPGFGFVLLEQEKGREQEGDTCLLKIGHQDFTVTTLSRGRQHEPVHTSAPSVSFKKDTPMRFVKRGRRLEIYEGGTLLGHYTTEKSYDRYKIGFYSNAGNSINRVFYISGAPQQWTTNPYNCGGGRIRFIKDGFRFEKCLYNAEVEDDNILIPPGKYYLTYESEKIDGLNDIKPYLFGAENESFDAEKKNILKEDLSFEIEEEKRMVLHFKGTSGEMKNISIAKNRLDGYVPTESGGRTTSGSLIILKLDGLSQARWKGTIERVPDLEDPGLPKTHSIFEVEGKFSTEKDLLVNIGKHYSYSLDVASMRLEVRDNEDKLISSISYPKKDRAMIFKNVRGFIDELIVTGKDGEETNVLIQKTTKVFVPAVIGGPIIVTDKDRSPLDMSSAYRIKIEGEDEVFEFTNWERELFDSNRTVLLEKDILDAPGNIVIYGIKKGHLYDESKIYRANSEMDPLPDFTRTYSVIPESSFDIDYYRNSITFKEDPAMEYEKLVIDYLKNRSYAVNYREDLHAYEVDVSTVEDGMFVMYDYKEDEEGSGSVEEYIITGVKPQEGGNRFVVLRKE